MRKYLLIGFLILTFSLAGLAQDSVKFKIEDFVLAKIESSKTVIFVGDRFELRLEIIYPKDWGIRILTEELEKNSMVAMLPDSTILEKAEIFQPISWNQYWMKITAIYSLFYPEKKHNTGILFFPQDTKPLKVRFKWVDEEEKELGENLGIYEADVQPGQFVLGVRSMLTDTSNSPRDSGIFSGNFFLKSIVAMLIGCSLILLVVYFPIKQAVVLIKSKSQTQKKVSSRRLLKIEYQKLKAVSKISEPKVFADSFCLLLRSIIGIKTGLKTLGMTAAEIKEEVAKDGQLINLAEILEEHDNFRYNPEISPIFREKAIKTVEEALSNWMVRCRWCKRLKIVLGQIIKITKTRRGW